MEQVLEGINILVDDDEIMSLNVLKRLLTIFGANVTTSKSTQMALANKPHLIIADLSMPNMSGWAFISALKDDPELADIPAIALTAHATVGIREKALSAGFVDYITKPISIATFPDNLISILKIIPALAELLKL